jgi:hypothetical protein
LKDALGGIISNNFKGLFLEILKNAIKYFKMLQINYSLGYKDPIHKKIPKTHSN